MRLEPGAAAPFFSRTDQDGTTVTLDDYAGHRLVIYFYPKDNTPGCTSEGQDFRDLYPEFAGENTMIFGVSRDGLKSHENFKAKQGFPFELLSDKDESLGQQFDVIKLKKNYGREYLGLDRSTFLIDSEGKLVREWRSVRVKGHVEDVLQAAQTLS